MRDTNYLVSGFGNEIDNLGEVYIFDYQNFDTTKIKLNFDYKINNLC